MLAEKILGTWELVSSEATINGKVSYPMGRDATGRLLYTADGHVGVNLMMANRSRPAVNAVRDLPDAEAAALARGYMAYSGPYSVDEEAAVIHHRFSLCLDPALIDTPQPRHARFVGGLLELSVPPMRRADGSELSVVLLWRRPECAT